MTSTVQFAAVHPLIDIDWTAFVQFGIFAVTALIATGLLFRPYLGMRDRRAAGIEGARGEAVRMTAEAEAKLVSYEQALAAARTRANEERRKVRGEAATHQREVTERARTEATQAMDAAKRRVAEQTASARAQLMPRAAELAAAIASRLLGRKVA
jgi:F-type H+-transporting ATPase subunit b